MGNIDLPVQANKRTSNSYGAKGNGNRHQVSGVSNRSNVAVHQVKVPVSRAGGSGLKPLKMVFRPENSSIEFCLKRYRI